MSTSDQIITEGCNIHLSHSADRQPHCKSKEALSSACTLSFGTKIRPLAEHVQYMDERLYHERLAQGIKTRLKR